MVAINQALLVVGGVGIPPKRPQPLAQYDDDLKGSDAGLARTNEHYLHNLGTSELRLVMTCTVCVCVWVCFYHTHVLVGGLLKDEG